MRNVEKDLPYGSNVLEAGCGTGQTLALFSAHHNTHCLDISPPASLNLSRKNCKNSTLANIFHIPYKDNTFDLVYNSGVIEHFKDRKYFCDKGNG